MNNGNPVFKCVINGHLDYILKGCGVLNIDSDLVDLLQCIFQYESFRIDLNLIKQKWMKKANKVN